jgi:hypothetical protein
LTSSSSKKSQPDEKQWQDFGDRLQKNNGKTSTIEGSRRKEKGEEKTEGKEEKKEKNMENFSNLKISEK